MKTTALVAVLLLLPLGCATMEKRSRMQKFGPISESFERALRTADYIGAAKYIDPAAKIAKPDFQKLRNFKIAEYRVIRTDVTEDQKKITLDVELQYFRLNGNILHRTPFKQIWHFLPEEKIWLLQTGLPDFGSQPPQPQRR